MKPEKVTLLPYYLCSYFYSCLFHPKALLYKRTRPGWVAPFSLVLWVSLAPNLDNFGTGSTGHILTIIRGNFLCTSLLSALTCELHCPWRPWPLRSAPHFRVSHAQLSLSTCMVVWEARVSWGSRHHSDCCGFLMTTNYCVWLAVQCVGNDIEHISSSFIVYKSEQHGFAWSLKLLFTETKYHIWSR